LLELSKVDVLRDIIENYGVNPRQIKLEITEILMVHDAENRAWAQEN
jgi:EAL domain-containing protein (putative c-di-GMP-specific phosphodiesterase class I)